MLPYAELQVTYRREDGRQAVLYLDANYNDAFALMHEDAQEDAGPWEEVQGECQTIQVYTLAPVDLAISKVARYSEQDRQDMLELARGGWFTPEAFRDRALEALGCYVGNVEPARIGVELMFEAMKSLERES